MKPSRKMVRAAAVLAVAGAMGLTACSSGSGSHATPINSVQSAIQGLGKQSSLQVSFSIPISAAQWRQLTGTGGSTPVPQHAAQTLSQSSIFLTMQTGHGEAIDSTTAETDTANAYSFGINTGSHTPIEIRYVGQNLYLMLNSDQLLSDYGIPSSNATAFKQGLNQIGSVIPGVGALASGGWVEVSHASLQQLLNLAKSAESGQSSTSTIPQARARQSVQRLVSQVGAILTNGTNVAQVGTTNGQTHYRATLHVNTVFAQLEQPVEQFLSSLGTVGSSVESQLRSNWTKAEAQIPANTTAAADLYTQSGRLTQASIDVNQFRKNKAVDFSIPLTLKFSSPPVLSAPSGATALNLSNLPRILQQLGSGSASSSSGL